MTQKQIIQTKRVRNYQIFAMTLSPSNRVILRPEKEGRFYSRALAEKEVFSRNSWEYREETYVILPVYEIEERMLTVYDNSNAQENFPSITRQEAEEFK